MTFKVDGQHLGWLCWFRGSRCTEKPRYIGLFERKNGVPISRALKFVTPTILNGINNKNSNKINEPMIGYVQIDIYEEQVEARHKNSVLNAPDEITKMEAAPISTPDDTISISKAKTHVVSVMGSCEKIVEREAIPRGNLGTLLQSFRLNYGTVVGLIHAGVIPKPSNIYEAYILMNPQKIEQSSSPSYDFVSNVTPKRIKFTNTIQIDGKDVVVEESYKDSFDLSQLPWSDSEMEYDE